MASDAVIRGYAEALFLIAQAEGDLDKVEDELYEFATTLESQSALREALTDPGLPADRKLSVITELLGGRASAHSIATISFVVEQGRAKDLPDIARAFATVAAERKQSSMAEVRSAVALTDEQREKIRVALTKATGRAIEVKTVIDPTVIGGVVTRIGDEIIDGSVRTRLDEASTRLRGA